MGTLADDARWILFSSSVKWMKRKKKISPTSCFACQKYTARITRSATSHKNAMRQAQVYFGPCFTVSKLLPSQTRSLLMALWRKHRWVCAILKQRAMSVSRSHADLRASVAYPHETVDTGRFLAPAPITATLFSCISEQSARYACRKRRTDYFTTHIENFNYLK
jgi:hypothetical protein